MATGKKYIHNKKQMYFMFYGCTKNIRNYNVSAWFVFEPKWWHTEVFIFSKLADLDPKPKM